MATDGAPPAGLSRVRRFLTGEIAAPPIARLVGFRPIEAAEGLAVFVLDAGERHANPMGTLHGGILCDVGDAAMGFAMATTLEEGESFTTIELKASFVKPVWTARLTATGRVVKRTRQLGLIECDVTDEAGGLVARLSSTCMVLRGEEARTR